jgi:hypothetical protein
LLLGVRQFPVAGPAAHPGINDDLGERGGAAGEGFPEGHRAVILELLGGVAAVGEDDGGEVAGGDGQAGVGPDGCLAAGAVGVEGDADASFGQVHGAGEGCDLLVGECRPAQRKTYETAGGGDADGPGVGESFHEDRLGACVEVSLAFG